MAKQKQGLYAQWLQSGGNSLAGPYASSSYQDDMAWCGSFRSCSLSVDALSAAACCDTLRQLQHAATPPTQRPSPAAEGPAAGMTYCQTTDPARFCCRAAIWLYRLTQDPRYLQEAAVFYKHYLDVSTPAFWLFI